MKIFIIIFILQFFIGCTISSKIQHDVVDFNRAVEATSNEVAFLNILRSYKRMPRHYTTISSLQGNLKVTAGTELSSSVNPGSNKTEATGADNAISSTLATARDTYSPKLFGNVTTNPSYSVGVLESQDFYRGLLRPIDVATIALYTSQGWDSELIMNIFIEGVWFEFSDNTREYLPNEVTSPIWRALAKCTSFSTTVNKVSAPFIVDKIKFTDDGIANLYNAGLTIQTCKNIDDDKNSCSQNEVYYIAGKPSASTALVTRERKKGCYDENYSNYNGKLDNKKLNPRLIDAVNLFLIDSLNFSDSGSLTDGSSRYLQTFSIATPTKGKQTDTAEDKKVKKVLLSTRSTDGIIYYLGEYLRQIESPKGSCESNKAEILIKNKDPMFRVCNSSSDGVLSVIFNGEDWTVPNNVPTRSMQVLGLTQQLINLNKASKDLPKPTFIQVN